MGIKIMQLAFDTGRMDLAAHALVLAAVRIKRGAKKNQKSKKNTESG
jgi:hypothetical protein